MPTKTLVKAGSITNLTDARFFAAYDVDYIGFCFDEKSPNYISPAFAAQITSWISGPKRIAEFANQDIDNVMNILDFFKPDIIQLDDAYFDNALIKADMFSIPVIIKTHETKIHNYIHLNPLYILIDSISEEVQLKNLQVPLMIKVSTPLKNGNSYHAIEVQGSLENEIGVKNYENIAEIFESLINEK